MTHIVVGEPPWTTTSLNFHEIRVKVDIQRIKEIIFLVLDLEAPLCIHRTNSQKSIC
jgi:hypothetical protein